MELYSVYVLKSEKTGELYKGITNNIRRRVSEHNLGRCPGTRVKGPWSLIRTETCNSRIEARTREKYLKSGIGREQLNNLINIPA